MITVAAVQYCASDDAAVTLDRIYPLIADAASTARLVALPEAATYLAASRTHLQEIAEPADNSFSQNRLAAMAREFDIWLLAGSLLLRCPRHGQLVNRSLLIAPDGSVAAQYDKIHMFDVKLNKKETYAESKTFTAGKKIKVANLPWGKLGLSICYDLRFPNHYRTMAKRGARFLAVPSNFLLNTGKRHWHSLLRARAIENFCYVFAPAQYGTHDNGIKVFGHSLIISPDGKILKELKKGEGVIVQKIDVKLPQLLRNKIPSLNKN